MISDHPDLFSARPEGLSAPQRLCGEQELIDSMLEWLAHAEDWLTAADILKHLDRPCNETEKRRLRAAAAASEGRIASGDLGYKLTCRCTVNEWLQFKHRMINQALATIRRVKQSQHHRRTPQLSLTPGFSQVHAAPALHPTVSTVSKP